MNMFLQTLRSRTAQQHRLPEQKTASKNLPGSPVTHADYAVCLSMFYSFVKGFQNIVFPLLQYSIPDMEERRKTHLPVAGLNTPCIDEAGIKVISEHFFAEEYQSYTTAPGATYAPEGSILGGAVILNI